MHRLHGTCGWCALAVVGLTACSSNPRLAPVVSAPQSIAVEVPAVAQALPELPTTDPVETVLLEAETEFRQGEQQLADGHLTEARAAFDRSLDILLQAPDAGVTDARIRSAFAQFVDRISTLEAAAIAAGDGFVEQPYEPASLDELLATSVFDGPPPPTPPELTRTVENDLAIIAHDIPIPTHDRVLTYVQLFTGRLRDWIQTGLQRGSRYVPMIQNVFRAEGLPLDLAFIPIIESAFNPNALSRKQARGVWQFMRQTGIENGLRHNWYVDERADPEKATVAAARYLKTLHKMFNGDWHLALASYNGGPGRVQRAMKQARSSDFWHLRSTTRFLPRETREYVPMILAAVIIGRNPSQYGFTVEPGLAVGAERIRVPAATDLRRLAEWIDIPVSQLQALNPELRRWTTPIRDDRYEIRVPEGTRNLVEEHLSTAAPSELSAMRWHTVKRGDTLTGLAKRFKVSKSELASANDLRTSAKLRPGQELAIPRTPAPLVTTENLRAATQESRAASARAISTYMVRRGDTLFSIAKRFGLSVEALKHLNGLEASRIHPGDRLTVRPDTTPVTQ